MLFLVKCLILSSFLSFAHILIAAQARTKELGLKWNVGARDGKMPELSALTQRLLRAQSNYFETFPMFFVGIVGVILTQQYNVYSHYAALIYLIARVIYIPLYAYGVPVIRTIVWWVSMMAIFSFLGQVLFS